MFQQTKLLNHLSDIKKKNYNNEIILQYKVLYDQLIRLTVCKIA